MTQLVSAPRVQTTDAAQPDSDVQILPPAGRSVATAQRRYLTAPSPWQLRDLTRTCVFAAVAAVGATACWYGASGEERWRDQIVWCLGAMLCGAVLGFAACTWLTVGFREVRRGFRELEVDRATVRATPQLMVSPSQMAAVGRAGDGQRYTASGMARQHRLECLLLRGKASRPVEPHERLAECGVCAR